MDVESVLTERERVLFSLLKSGKPTELDAIEKALKTKTGAAAPRKGLIVNMKYLAAKIARYGYVIENLSGIGAGKKAVYRMSKKF